MLKYHHHTRYPAYPSPAGVFRTAAYFVAASLAVGVESRMNCCFPASRVAVVASSGLLIAISHALGPPFCCSYCRGDRPGAGGALHTVSQLCLVLYHLYLASVRSPPSRAGVWRTRECEGINTLRQPLTSRDRS